MRYRLPIYICFYLVVAGILLFGGESKKQDPAPIQTYIREVRSALRISEPSPGSLYVAEGRFSDLAGDLRAARIGDLVTILVSDQATAISRGATSAGRKSSMKAGIPALWGPRIGPLANLANLGSETQLDGAGTTSRSNVLTTTLTAKVVDVLPNGYLVLEGTKDVQANSEKQRVTVLGVIRWNDLSPRNTVLSDRVGQMEIRIDGKGVVSDATRRPNILYRILQGVLPF